MAGQRLIRPGAFAREASVTLKTVKRWLTNGDLEFVRLPGGERRIPESELHRLMQRQRAAVGDSSYVEPQLRG